MHRRNFLILSSAALVLPVAGHAKSLTYTPGLIKKHLGQGETVFVDFKASWCSTCAAQERVLDKHKSKNPAYEKNITFIDVDWDDYRTSDIVRELKIPRRSTLVVLKGNQELGRIVAGTSSKQIKALMDTALQAATA